MKYILLLIFLINQAFAAPAKSIEGGSALYSFEPQRGRSYIATSNYQDLRIDSDLDGKIDFWSIKSGGMTIEIFFSNGSPSLFTARKILDKSNVSEFAYQKKGSVFKLAYSRIREPITSTYDEPSEKANQCQQTLKDLNEQLKKFTLDLNEDNVYSALEDNLLDKSCKDDESGSFVDRFASVLGKQDRISKCLAKNGKYRQSLPPGADNDLNVEILSAQYEIQKRQLVEKSEDHPSTFVCEPNSVPKKAPASTHESGRVVFLMPIDKNDQRKVIEHELVHRSGAFSEDSTQKIISVCTSDKSTKIEDLSKDADSKSSDGDKISMPDSKDVTDGTKVAGKNSTANTAAAVTSSNIQAAEKKVAAVEVAKTNPSSSITTKNYDGVTVAAKSSTANIPKELTGAQTGIPASEDLSSNIYNHPANTDAGSKIALNNSYKQSSGVLKAANNIMGTMTTPALANSLAAQKAAISATAAELAKSQQLNGSRMPAALAGANVKADETVVESISLDNQTQVAARADTSIAIQPKNPTTDSRNLPATNNTGSIPRTAGLNSVAADPGSVQVNPSGSNQQVSLGAGPQNTQRQPASAARAAAVSSVGNPSVSREEVITYISQGDFNRTKQRLKDPGFTKQLENQNITVLDLYGNSVGAKKGEVIFLEKEDRFVRQK